MTVSKKVRKLHDAGPLDGSEIVYVVRATGEPSDRQTTTKALADFAAVSAAAPKPFTSLTDVPPVYTGGAGKSVRVNATETGLEFVTPSLGSGDVVGPASAVDGTPMVADGATGKLIKNIAYAAFKTLLALVKGDVGLGNVDNTSDVNKPVSTAQAAADALRITDPGGANDDVLQRKAGGWINRTIAQLKTDLGLAGSNTGDQTIALTGDVTGSGTGSFAATIAAAAVTLAKMANMATASLIYRRTAGTGVPEVNTLAQLKTDLVLVKADVGLGNVDNTSDVNKPVSTAQATADALAIQASLLTTRGDIIYRDATGPQRLPKGTAGQALVMGANDPVWANRDVPVTGILNGGGAAIVTGVAGDLEIPFAGTIVGVTLLADQSGSIVVDLWKDTYANYPPTVADTITAAALPTISTALKAKDTTLTGWTTSVALGDIIRFNVNSCTSITRCAVCLTIRRT